MWSKKEKDIARRAFRMALEREGQQYKIAKIKMMAGLDRIG